MGAVKAFVVTAVIAGVIALVAGLLPVTATATVQTMPDIPFVDIAARVGGKYGVTLTPDKESFRVDCGSAFAPNEFDFKAENGLGKLLRVAERAESAVSSVCDSELESSRTLAVGSGAVSGALFVIALLAGLIGAVASSQAGIEAKRRRTGRQRTVRVAIALGIIVVVFRLLSSSGSEEVAAGSAESGQPLNPAEVECVDRVLTASTEGWQEASASSRSDTSRGRLNLDGDASYLDYASHLSNLDTTACSAGFRSAFGDWITVWREYGAFKREAARPHAPWNDDWSEGQVTRRSCGFIHDIQLIDDTLRAEARDLRLEYADVTWTFPGC